MSDDDFMMDDNDDYGFDYESDDGGEPDANIENQYYNAKALKEDSPKEALACFEKALKLETEPGEWGFKTLKQMVKLNFKIGQYGEAMKSYKQMLTYVKGAVTKNYSEKSINTILDLISTSSDMSFMENFYATTLEVLEDTKNERLWTKSNLKLAKLYLDRAEYTRLAKTLKQLHQTCKNEDGTDDVKKGTQLLEIYALEIQMYTATKNNKKLKELYRRSLHIKSAIPHPRILGIIRECGGKMHMYEEQWEKAHEDFFEAFKSYDEAGSPRRIQCLKYLVLANMLKGSDIDPFTAQETKPYKSDPEIVAMTNLVSAFQRKEISEFEKILKDNRKTIMDDQFIKDHIEELLKSIRTQVLLKLIKPYTRIEISFISKELNISTGDVENLIIGLILDGKVDGQIDQINQRLELTSQLQSSKKYISIEKWANQLENIQRKGY